VKGATEGHEPDPIVARQVRSCQTGRRTHLARKYGG
jgi:hypothetical protein